MFLYAFMALFSIYCTLGFVRFEILVYYRVFLLRFINTCGVNMSRFSGYTWGVQFLRSPNFFLGEWKQIET